MHSFKSNEQWIMLLCACTCACMCVQITFVINKYVLHHQALSLKRNIDASSCTSVEQADKTSYWFDFLIKLIYLLD